MNICFLALLAEDEAGTAGAPGPGEGVASTLTVVFESAMITLRWKRVGMEVRSCWLVGRMRRAVGV